MNLIIQGGALPTFLLERISAATGASTVEPRPPQVVRLKGATHTPEFNALIPLIEAEKLDWAFVEADRKLSDFGLICFDMDSTLITIECIDELADFAGKKEEVSTVTFAAKDGGEEAGERITRLLKLREDQSAFTALGEFTAYFGEARELAAVFGIPRAIAVPMAGVVADLFELEQEAEHEALTLDRLHVFVVQHLRKLIDELGVNRGLPLVVARGW